ncbi:MAG TPA: dihydropteroate synthase [Methanocorpusculum sp.]|nr:dihydropteroate synthase [Methanocorpusculum sp.]
MHVLFLTGSQSAEILKNSLTKAEGFTAEVVVTGEVASFLTPAKLTKVLRECPADSAIVSGMCTADFSGVEKETGIPVFRGTRHAADIKMCFSLITAGKLSKTLAADVLLDAEKKKQAEERLQKLEDAADACCTIRGIKLGGNSRIKVISEIMDAQRNTSLRKTAEAALVHGADGIDLGFGFDAAEEDVIRCFKELEDLPCILSVDTLNPALIKASLFRADLIFSLTADTIPELADAVKEAGCAAVLIPRGKHSLEDTISAAKDAGLSRIFADPLLQPPLSGMTESLAGFLPDAGIPKIMGCVNTTELIDADSPGICAILAASAAECGCAAVLISEHSDKTKGAVSEMRRAVNLMQTSSGRPYPKDTGCDVFVIKEKRKRVEPALSYEDIRDAEPLRENLSFDPCGNFRIGLENGKIVAVRNGHAIRGDTAEEVFASILAEGGVSLLDHAAYLGKELYKAELSLRFGRSFEQDGVF